MLTSAAGLGLGLATSACQLDPSSSGAARPPSPIAAPTSDDLLLTRAQHAVADLHRTADALARRHRDLRPLVRLHDAHLRALDAAPRRRRPAGPLPEPAVLRAHELATARDLTDLAVRAQSGSLATLFATIAASIPMFYREGP